MSISPSPLKGHLYRLVNDSIGSLTPDQCKQPFGYFSELVNDCCVIASTGDLSLASFLLDSLSGKLLTFTEGGHISRTDLRRRFSDILAAIVAINRDIADSESAKEVQACPLP